MLRCKLNIRKVFNCITTLRPKTIIISSNSLSLLNIFWSSFVVCTGLCNMRHSYFKIICIAYVSRGTVGIPWRDCGSTSWWKPSIDRWSIIMMFDGSQGCLRSTIDVDSTFCYNFHNNHTRVVSLKGECMLFSSHRKCGTVRCTYRYSSQSIRSSCEADTPIILVHVRVNLPFWTCLST